MNIREAPKLLKPLQDILIYGGTMSYAKFLEKGAEYPDLVGTIDRIVNPRKGIDPMEEVNGFNVRHRVEGISEGGPSTSISFRVAPNERVVFTCYENSGAMSISYPVSD